MLLIQSTLFHVQFLQIDLEKIELRSKSSTTVKVP